MTSSDEKEALFYFAYCDWLNVISHSDGDDSMRSSNMYIYICTIQLIAYEHQDHCQVVHLAREKRRASHGLSLILLHTAYLQHLLLANSCVCIKLELKQRPSANRRLP